MTVKFTERLNEVHKNHQICMNVTAENKIHNYKKSLTLCYVDHCLLWRARVEPAAGGFLQVLKRAAMLSEQWRKADI